MRLIDADALIEQIRAEAEADTDTSQVAMAAKSVALMMCVVIGKQPTIQPDVPDINVGDTISRQAAIDAVAKWLYDVFGITDSDGTATIFKRLRELPSAQPERKTGRWIPRYYDVGADVFVEWRCSECGYVRKRGREDGGAGDEPEAKLCEMCGAKMGVSE